jgi:hypothetical protein
MPPAGKPVAYPDLALGGRVGVQIKLLQRTGVSASRFCVSLTCLRYLKRLCWQHTLQQRFAGIAVRLWDVFILSVYPVDFSSARWPTEPRFAI